MSAELTRELTANFIRDSVSPVVAVLVSYDAELVCQKNNLSFCELLAPFNKLSSDAAFKDPSNQSHLVKSLMVDFRDLRRDGFLTSNALPLALTELVRAVPVACDQTAEEEPGNKWTGVVPWYEQYRKQFLKLLEPSEHEFIRNYLACVLVVSTSYPDPLDQITRLSQAQHVFQHQLGQTTGQGSEKLHLPTYASQPKWFSPNIFKFNLLLHDVSSGDDKKAEAVYQSMKMTYGAHACHLLRINSNSMVSDESSMPDPWASYLKNNLRHFDSIRISADQHTNFSDENNFEANDNSFHTQSTELIDDISSLDMEVPAGNGTVENGGLKPPAKVVRSESIPHPLSSNDLMALVDSGDAPPHTVLPSLDAKHGRHLSPSDIDRIKIFVQEFCLRGLLPFVERQLKLLNDQVTISSRRSLISKSLVTSAKRWFTSGSSPNLPSVAANTASSPDKAPVGGFRPTQALTYPPESVEMQMRRMADLAFLFQHYELAYQHYYALKKEFSSAGAWLHQAGSAEFASLCVYLSGPSTATPYPNHYMDTALTTYSTTCGKPWLANRATIFGAEILISQNTASAYSEAAGMYIRMTTGDDLSGALFLERAAWCFTKAKLYRKAALHLILAGHRYRKSNLVNHTVRCYELANIAYQFRGWQFAEDHINFTLTSQCRSPPMAQETSNEKFDVIEKFKQLRRYCFSSEYLSTMRHSIESLLAFVSQKPLPVGLSPKTVEYIYGPRPPSEFGRSLDESLAKMCRKSALSPDVVSCRLHCSSAMSHDFNTSNLCFVPVELTLFNQHSALAVKVVLKLYTGSQSFSDFLSKLHVCQPITWTRSCYKIVTLKPNESKLINLLGYTTVPGVYDVGNLLFKCYPDDGGSSGSDEFEMKLQSHFVTVRQS